MKKPMLVLCFVAGLSGCLQNQLTDKRNTRPVTAYDALHQQVVDNLAHLIVDPNAQPKLELAGWKTEPLQGLADASSTPVLDFIAGIGSDLKKSLVDEQSAANHAGNGSQENGQLVVLNNAAPLSDQNRQYLMQCAYRKAISSGDDTASYFALNWYYHGTNPSESLVYSGKPIETDMAQDTPSSTHQGQPVDTHAEPGIQLTSAASAQMENENLTPTPTKIPYESFLKPGWFKVGKKQEIPKRGVCYVGHYRDTYVWVMRSHQDDLTRFTLALLEIATAKTFASTSQSVSQTK